MNITQFSIEEVRCFAERQNFEIRPLTFLVGENSTGKTTVLGCFQALADCFGEGIIDFKRFPYSMENFRDIVRNSRKKEKTFKLGFNFEHEKENVEWILEFGQEKKTHQPIVIAASLKFRDGEIACIRDFGLERDTHLADVDAEKNRYRIIHDCNLTGEFPPSAFLRYVMSEAESEDEKALQRYLETKPATLWQDKPIPAFSVTPIRLHLGTFYNSTKISDDPEGSDGPMQLMERRSDQRRGMGSLETAVDRIWKDFRTFSRHRNQKPRTVCGYAPFQLKVKVRGTKRQYYKCRQRRQPDSADFGADF